MSKELTVYNHRVVQAIQGGHNTIVAIALALHVDEEVVRRQVFALQRLRIIYCVEKIPYPGGGAGGGWAVYDICPGVVFEDHPKKQKRFVAVAHFPKVAHG